LLRCRPLPFTLQTTVVSLAFVIVAVNIWGLPKITVALAGVTVTAIDPEGPAARSSQE
jgi:hypothetical protein